MKQLKNQRGLTLIELLAVIVILAIIAAIAAVAIGNVINNSKDKAILSDAVTIIDGAKIGIMDDAFGDDTNGTITIEKKDKGELEKFVELSGEKWDGFEKLEITGMNTGKTEYTLTYAPLGKIKNQKYQPTTPKSNTATLEEILAALDGKKEANSGGGQQQTPGGQQQTPGGQQ